jgi:hypothetical protein
MHRDAYKPGLEPTGPSAAHFVESEAGLNRKCNDEAVGWRFDHFHLLSQPFARCGGRAPADGNDELERSIVRTYSKASAFSGLRRHQPDQPKLTGAGRPRAGS